MTHDWTTRPDSTECAPYYGSYVDEVPQGDVLDVLDRQIEDTRQLLSPLSDEQALHRYAPEKWSIKEIVGHLTDAELIFAYRALRFAREDTTPLAGFGENDYVTAAGFDRIPLRDLLDQFVSVRASTLHLFRSLDPSALSRRGEASGAEFTVRVIPFILSGHERHHVRVIKERYL